MFETNPTVSVVIPTFNRSDLLPQAIDSVLAQTYPAEIIVVDHGSRDRTPEVVQNYGDKIRYLRRDEDFGPHFCWLDGVLHSTGEFVHLQFDDDLLSPSFIEKTVSLFDDDVGFTFSLADVFDHETEKTLSTQFSDWVPRTAVYQNEVIEKKILQGLISPAAAVYRKQVLLDALYQGRLPLGDNYYHGVGPDCFVTLLSMLRYPKVGVVTESLAQFRSHKDSITVDAYANEEKTKRIAAAYNDVKVFYKDLKRIKWLRQHLPFLLK
ncbi:glycosyltransferase family 2 protein [Roseibium sp.]|uniref:glycosyltransferase family 2 protein n=1 Tax=Roseibium sp. TaxID=1936156 RepID=UPI003A975EEF